MPPVSISVAGGRRALVVATATCTDPGLSTLRSPAQDADDMANVLADPAIGRYLVTKVIDKPASEVREQIEDFLAESGRDDLVVVYLSCHGLLDQQECLYFATSNTRKNRLGSTSVEAAWLLGQRERCQARRQVLILDCCF